MYYSLGKKQIQVIVSSAKFYQHVASYFYPQTKLLTRLDLAQPDQLALLRSTAGFLTGKLGNKATLDPKHSVNTFELH